jgi:hypothetical protein
METTRVVGHEQVKRSLPMSIRKAADSADDRELDLVNRLRASVLQFDICHQLI